MKVVAELFGIGCQFNIGLKNTRFIVYQDITKRKLIISFLMMFVLFGIQKLDSIPTPLYGQFSDPGFDGIDFGSDVFDGLVFTNTSDNIDWYIRPDDSLQIENVRLMDVKYCFRNGKFVEVIIHVNRRNFDKLRNLLIQSYGPSSQLRSGGPIQIWLHPTAIMSLIYFPNATKCTWHIVSSSVPDRFPLLE